MMASWVTTCATEILFVYRLAILRLSLVAILMSFFWCMLQGDGVWLNTSFLSCGNMPSSSF